MIDIIFNSIIFIFTCFSINNFNTFLLILSIDNFDKSKKLNQKNQKGFVEMVARLVAVGLIHNDLHYGNIGKLPGKDGQIVLFDYGLAQLIDPPTHILVYAQIVMAQLYSLIDSCNNNNVKTFNDYCGKNNPIVDTINGIRKNDEKTMAALEKIRVEVQGSLISCRARRS